MSLILLSISASWLQSLQTTSILPSYFVVREFYIAFMQISSHLCFQVRKIFLQIFGNTLPILSQRFLFLNIWVVFCLVLLFEVIIFKKALLFSYPFLSHAKIFNKKENLFLNFQDTGFIFWLMFASSCLKYFWLKYRRFWRIFITEIVKVFCYWNIKEF